MILLVVDNDIWPVLFQLCELETGGTWMGESKIVVLWWSSLSLSTTTDVAELAAPPPLSGPFQAEYSKTAAEGFILISTHGISFPKIL
jgi:hypothetical protein